MGIIIGEQEFANVSLIVFIADENVIKGGVSIRIINEVL